MLYLVKTNEFYKIGFTTNVEKRMSTYTTCNPVIELLGIKEGTKNDESAYHLSFCNYEGTGEWYKIPEEIINEIKKDFIPYSTIKRPDKKFISKTEEYKNTINLKDKKRDRSQYYKEREKRPERIAYMKQYSKQYRQNLTEEQKQKQKEYQKQYRKCNKEKLKKQQKAWREKNKATPTK